ncbi:alkaline phosphatase D family protein [Streptomyces sp. Z26]|uniref:alkaline phosphatase D family protein n=1 Tax=Streptomyces sp. Z26 TaxID=2500177 RepID=UPI000EF15D6B|nr:alkaline phosphatase D family protein [Streptomyces sp. Z26]RLL66998.1 hypothetical protein D7M15_09105 [Streptomyces sp. Z26]
MAYNVQNVWLGAATDTSVWVRCRTVPPVSVTLLVSTSPDLSGALALGPAAPTAEGVVSWQVTGLEPDTRYWYATDDGAVSPFYRGTFRTHPPVGERASFAFGAAGDAGHAGAGDLAEVTNGVSDAQVFEQMRHRAGVEEWVQFCHLGDLHYRNINTNSPAAFRQAYTDTLSYNLGSNSSAKQGHFFRTVPMTYVWDDHDYGPNNSDRLSVARPAAQQVYRERVPHYPLPHAEGIYQSWQVGRVLFIASDVRSFRDPNTDPQTPSKTMLGAAQKTWMENLLTTTDAAALVWISPSQWMSDTDDSWARFRHERDQVTEMLGDTGWLRRMVQLTADRHALAIASGPANPWGNFPIFMFAGLDAVPSDIDPAYDIGMRAARQQYGTMHVRDHGHTISLTGTGRYISLANGQWQDNVWRSHTAYVHVGSPSLALGYRQVAPPLEPVDDDQQLRNDIAVQRDGGGEARVLLGDGPLSVQPPPDGVGTYDDAVTVNVVSDEQLLDQAGWRLRRGTVDAARYPTLRLDLTKRPDLIPGVAALSEGDRITISDPPEWEPPGPIAQIVEGTTEILRPRAWEIEVNASPAAPWTVAEAAPGDETTAGPTGPRRLDTSGALLADAVSEAGTVLLVHTPPDGPIDRAPWAPSAGPTPTFAPEYPYDLSVGGETVRALSCAPAVWDTFARTASSGWGSVPSGGAWAISGGASADYSVTSGLGRMSLGSANVARWALTPAPAPDVDLRATFAVDKLAAGAAHLLALVARTTDVNNGYLVRLALNTNQTITLSLRKRVAGTETQLAEYTPALLHVAGAAYAVRLQLEGSTLRAKLWPSGSSEPRWHVTTVDTAHAGAGQLGVRVILGAGSTTTLPVLVTVADLQTVTPQRLTVERSVNGIVKPQAKGAAVSLAQPAYLAL